MKASLLLSVATLLLASCVHSTFYRAKNHPLAPGDLQQVKDAPALVDLPSATVELRSHSVNSFIHVGMIIRAKKSPVTYTKTTVKIKALDGDRGYKAEPDYFQYLCGQRGWSEELKLDSTKTVEITPECPLKISVSFDTATKITDIYTSGKVRKGFRFEDFGLGQDSVISVELTPFKE